MEVYGFDWRTMTESECMAELFKLYQKLVDAEKNKVSLDGGDLEGASSFLWGQAQTHAQEESRAQY